MNMITLAILEMVVISIVLGHSFKVNKDYSTALVLMTFASIIFNSSIGMEWYFVIIPIFPVGVWIYRITK